MLPPSLCDEVRNDKRLTFTGFIDRVCFARQKCLESVLQLTTTRQQWLTRYSGLSVLQDGLKWEIIQEALRKNLNQELGMYFL